MTVYLNAYSTVTDVIDGAPQQPCSHRTILVSPSIGDDDAVTHLRQFEGFVMQHGVQRAGDVTASLIALRNHIRNTHNQYVFEVADNFSPAHLAAFADWAAKANAIFVMADMSVRDASGLDLLDPGAQIPRPDAAQRRMYAVRGRLWNEGIQIPQHLPAVWDATELSLRGSEDLFNRAVTSGVVATIARLSSEGQSIDFAALEAGAQRTFSHLSPGERGFVESVRSGQLTDRTVALDCMEYSAGAADTLAWLVGLSDQPVDRLVPPDMQALRPSLRSVDREGRDASQLPRRPLDQVADNLEFSTCMRWWDVEHPVDRARSQYIAGRLHALQWAYSQVIAWDDIQLDV